MVRVLFGLVAVCVLALSFVTGTAVDDGVSMAMFVVLAIYDRKTEAYGPLIQARSLPAAVRAFGDELVSGQAKQIVDHAEDYDLVKLGNYDELSGSLEVNDPQLVITAAALVRQLKSGQEAVPMMELQDGDRLDRGVGVDVPVAYAHVLNEEARDNG